MTAQRVLGALALVFALAHAPFIATSLEDIDSVNFALGVRDFDVATHRPHPPGYPVYIALGKIAAAIAGAGTDAPPSTIEARALSVLSLLSGLAAIVLMYFVFTCFRDREDESVDIPAIAAAAIAASCPLFWYLAVRPMSDLPGLAFALAAVACLMLAWQRQRPAGGDRLPAHDAQSASWGPRRLSPAVMAASGRMIVAGAFLAAFAIGVRSQTVWFTVPLLVVVLFDRIGRGVAGALIGVTVTFMAGGLAWGIPLLVASGGLNAYLAALGTQAGEDFASGEMLYTNPSPRAAAFALIRTFVHPWDSTVLAAVVLAVAAAGVVQLLLRDRRSIAPIAAMSVPYLVFHLLLQDTSFVRYALPLVPVVSFLSVRGVMLLSPAAVPLAAAAISLAGVAIASPVLVAYAAEPSPVVRVLRAMHAELRHGKPGALAMHHTFVRPLEAEAVGFDRQLPSSPRIEWLELDKYWNSGATEPIWFLADPIRSDLALIDPHSRDAATDVRWPLVARPAFGGMRPSAVRWHRLSAPGWFAEEGWALSPEAAGISQLMGRGPHLAPITAKVRRRRGAARLLVGGRNLAGPNDPAARFTLAIDGASFQQWETKPGFFLHVFDIPPGRLAGEGALATLTLNSAAVSGSAPIPTAIEQFDLQDAGDFMWAYGDGWQEAEFSPALGVWRWTSELATLRIVGPPQRLRITMWIESPLRYFDEPPLVRAAAGKQELAATTLSTSREWSFDVTADVLAASGGTVAIATDRTFVPSERGGTGDQRRLGLRVFAIRVSNLLTPTEVSR